MVETSGRGEIEEVKERSHRPDCDCDNEIFEEEYEVTDLKDGINSTRGSRFNLIENEFILYDDIDKRLIPKGFLNRIKNFFINPDNRWYLAWKKFIVLWAAYSSFFTPMEFGFFRGLPENLLVLDITGQVAFLVDIVLQFFVAFRDSETYRMVYNHTPVAVRYLKSTFVIDLLGCLPWDIIYKASGRKEEVRYLLWIRLSRFRILIDFFHKLEKDIRINYMFTRILKLILIELYSTHTAACIFYYLATTLPETQEGYTWIGSLKLGEFSYSHFREIDLGKRYTTSLYFAFVTMTSVGYGDIHAVNLREMIFIMIYVSFDMLLSAYLTGNMTALIVKGSKTEKFRDKMTDAIKYMNRNKIGRELRNQIKGHLRLQYESTYTEAVVLQDIPISIRAKISKYLYLPFVEKVPLFTGCSSEFINQLVSKLHEEFFLPGEVIIEQGYMADQLYFVCLECRSPIRESDMARTRCASYMCPTCELEEIFIEDGSEASISLLQCNSSFGEVSILCNIPQPSTIRVCELCRLLRIDKQSFTSILETYFHDCRKIFNNLVEEKKFNLRVKQLESEITMHIGKQESELALKVNNAAYHGDLFQLKGLIRVGADPNKTDYDGRSPLHLAASRGYENVVLFLIQQGADVNFRDNFGNTPLLEAIKTGHDQTASLLVRVGASLRIENAGSFLCTIVSKGDADYLKRILSNGIDPDSKNYDDRTPLHVAASEGLCLMAKVLLDSGASVFSKDRWGNSPVDESRRGGNRNLIKLLEDAKSAQLAELQHQVQDISVQLRPKKCTVFPFHPWDNDHRRHGIVLWIPLTMEELIKQACEILEFSGDGCILSENGGKILDVDMIDDGQKLYLVSETH